MLLAWREARSTPRSRSLDAAIAHARCGRHAGAQPLREALAAAVRVVRGPRFGTVDGGIVAAVEMDRQEDVGVGVARDGGAVGERQVDVGATREAHVGGDALAHGGDHAAGEVER